MPQAGEDILIKASAAQCVELAALNNLASLEHLEAKLTVKTHGRELHVRGLITALVHYTCVVTLEPFPATISEKVNVTFAPPSSQRVHRHLDLSFGDEAPEDLVDGEADVGALVQEFFQLALDPYPRKPGVTFSAEAPETAPAPQDNTPRGQA